MAKDNAQNGDLDFEQMMGELAAMKTDLANRQASRVARPAIPRAATSDSEPRRTRLRRAQTEPHHELAGFSVDTAAGPSPSVVSSQSVLSPTLPVVKRSAALAASLREADYDTQEQSYSQGQDWHPQEGEQSHQPEMRIGAASSNADVGTRVVQSSEMTASEANDTFSNGGSLGRSESRRNPAAAPLPPKSAQRSRSISNNSSRLSRTLYNDSGEIMREVDGHHENLSASPQQEVSTPTFGSNGAPHRFLRPYPSSPSLTTASNGQTAQGSPRLPARSNSRSNAKPSPPSSGSSSTFEQNPPQGSPGPYGSKGPIVPPRSKSTARPLSRSNTFSRPEGGQDHNVQYSGTPTIAEDSESFPQSPQEQHKHFVSSEAQQGVEHMRKKSSSNALRRQAEESSGHSLAPSLLPADPLPSPMSDRYDHSSTHDEDDQGMRPALRKQKSADPAVMYRQHHHQPEPSTVSRHASERRPNRDRSQSNTGNSPYMESREESRFREPSGDSQQGQERGRGQRQEQSSKGGMFSFMRSRSKSKDASHARQQETPAYPEYNPALIPSRSTSSAGNQRAKSLPRKPSNQNLHANNEGWPPYAPAALNGNPTTPGGPSHQHNRSLSKPGLNPPPFNSLSTSTNDASTPQSAMSLNISTNMNTTHHDKMIRGMGMGSTPISPAVLLTPQPSFPTTIIPPAAPGGMRNIALAMMKQDGSPSASELQMQQRHQQLQQAQMQHLQQQQQRLAATVTNSVTSPPQTPTSPRHQFNGPQGPLSPSAAGSGPASVSAQQATQRLVATRIYIQTEIDFKSLNLAPNSTALDVLHMLQQRGSFGERGDPRYHDRWTVFEYSKDFLIERPLRDFEIVLDVMKTWEAEKDHKMICKSFPARDELSAKEIMRLVGPAGQAGFVRPQGWVHLETKKSKWVKRYLHVTDTAVYHSKDNKFNGESMLCLLRNFDVYAVQVPRKKAPTKFGFALKSSDSIHLFETPEDDYIHYVCTESGDSLREWLAGLRAAKGMAMYHANPELIRAGERRAAELMSSSGNNQDGSGSLAIRGNNLTDEQAIDETQGPIQTPVQTPIATTYSGSIQGVPSFSSSSLSTTSTKTSAKTTEVSSTDLASAYSPVPGQLLQFTHQAHQQHQEQYKHHYQHPHPSQQHDYPDVPDHHQEQDKNKQVTLTSIPFKEGYSSLSLSPSPLHAHSNQDSSPQTPSLSSRFDSSDISTSDASNTDVSNTTGLNPSTADTTNVIDTTDVIADIIIEDAMPPSNNDSGSTGGTPNVKNPFMAGSLLQQRVEAEKQEVELMKQQLKIREQAGVLGAARANIENVAPSPNYQHGGHGRGLSSTESANSLSSANTTQNHTHQQYQPHQYSRQQSHHQLLQGQHQHPQQQQLQQLQQQLQPAPVFGGPGTLIEKGEARAAQLLERSKSAGAGLLRPSGGGPRPGYQRTRSKSRGPAEDRVRLGGSTSPHSQSSGASPGGAPAVPQGPLLHFAESDAMIQPGLLLSRAKSAKQTASGSGSASGSPMNSAAGGSGYPSSHAQQQTRSPGSGPTKSRQATGGASSHNLLGQQQQGSSRPRMKPLIDLGNINTNQDMIGPGLLTKGTNNYTAPTTQSTRSPQRRQPKPLLEF